MKCQVVPLDTATALLAADLHRQHKLAIVDDIVCVTALRQGAQLLTCDTPFKGPPDVVSCPKTQA